MGSFRDKFSKKQYKTACFINKEKKNFSSIKHILSLLFFRSIICFRYILLNYDEFKCDSKIKSGNLSTSQGPEVRFT